ncbi:MAG: hypothetical protein KDA62_22285, partial [Planctomycetales bacterium]|nr:hypothetical protein [Planctomycetales bacterium]
VVVDARSTLMGYGFAAQMPGASPKEAELLVPEVTRRMEEALVESRQFHQKANGDKVNQDGAIDFAANENRLYEMRALRRRLEAAGQLGRYSRDWITDPKARTRSVISPDHQARIDQLAGLTTQVQQASYALDEYELTFRLAQFRHAVKLLDGAVAFRDRLLAIGVIDEDGPAIREVLGRAAQANWQYTNAELNDPNLSVTIQATGDAALATSPEILEKSRLFRQGLQWWLRGRYGRGPDGYGLLKSELALISPAAQMGLYLPNETPTPTDPANPSITAVPEVDRRHHYIWGMEYRRVQQVSSESMTATGKSTNRWPPVPLDSRGRGTGGNPSGRSQYDSVPFTVVSHWNVVQSSITAEDSRFINRLVGFQEYSNALQKLDRLSSLSTPEEFAVYDELVGQRDEFCIYTNLSRRWERQPSS